MSGPRERLAMRLLRLYPRRWRDRYEVEVRALVEEHSVRPRTLADLVAGAVDARLDPAYRMEEDLMPKPFRRGSSSQRCSFCGKGKEQVRRLVAGPGVFICDGCVELCNEVLAAHDRPAGGPPPPGGLPAPSPGPRAARWSWLRNVFRSTAPRPADA